MKVKIGDKVGRLEVIGKSDKIGKNSERYLICKCDCGNICEVASNHLAGHTTRSCGCLARQVAKENMEKFTQEKIDKGIMVRIGNKTSHNLLNEKYISKCRGYYYVRIRNRFMQVNKCFYELDRAIAFRNEMYEQLQDKLNKGGGIND